jgi:hypothetical protein
MLKSTDRKYAKYFNLTDMTTVNKSHIDGDGNDFITWHDPEPKSRFDTRGVSRQGDSNV